MAPAVLPYRELPLPMGLISLYSRVLSLIHISTDDIYKLPDFIRVTLFDGEILTNDWTNLIIDEEVFKNLPSEDHQMCIRDRIYMVRLCIVDRCLRRIEEKKRTDSFF